MRTPREWICRLWGTLRRVRSDADLQEELRVHMELAAEEAQRRGQPPGDAARAARLHAGGAPQAMDALRDQRGLPWLDALAADFIFGWRQLNKHRVSTAAAVVSLGLAIGATTAAFRLVDALLLRPLPVAEPGRLFVVAATFVDPGGREERDDFDYPTYREYSNTVRDKADLMVVGVTGRQPVMFGAAGEPEAVFRQFLSGNVFTGFRLRPALGRLLTPADDLTPGAHPVAVLSYDYWTRRFGGDPAVVGTTFRAGSQQFEIVGVGPEGFTGTEPGRVTDLFMPATMNVQALDKPGWSWFRIWLRPKAGVSADQVRQILQARSPWEIRLLPAGAGVSGVQKTFRRPLLILAALAGLVLLIACANVANLLIAQATARTREMALRISIGAGRWRLIQLVLAESALLALLASAAAAVFASWSAPLVVSLLASAEQPVRLTLHADWRALGFGVGLALVVTVLFGLGPAVRASSVEPVGSLRQKADRYGQRGLTGALIGAQMAFCVFLLFSAGLFVSTLNRLLNQPLGFSHHDVMLLQTESRSKQPSDIWAQVARHLRQFPAVDSVAVAGWAPLTGNRWRAAVRADGRPVPANSPHFLGVSSGYFATLRIEMIQGRDFHPADAPPRLDERKQPLAGVGIVSEAFARVYLGGEPAVGRRVQVRVGQDAEAPMEIVGVVRDAVYYSVREAVHPMVYVPFEARNNGTVLVRTSGDPLPLRTVLRREVSRIRPDFRVRAAEPLTAFVMQQMIRERLLAALSTFFALVALLLAAIGLYGVLNHAVIRQRREIGIRMALGARAADVLRRITIPLAAIVGVGCVAGLAGGIAFGRAVDALLFRVKPTDPAAVALPLLALAAAAALAALPPAIRAVRTDPAQTLRTE